MNNFLCRMLLLLLISVSGSVTPYQDSCHFSLFHSDRSWTISSPNRYRSPYRYHSFFDFTTISIPSFARLSCPRPYPYIFSYIQRQSVIPKMRCLSQMFLLMFFFGYLLLFFFLGKILRINRVVLSQNENDIYHDILSDVFLLLFFHT